MVFSLALMTKSLDADIYFLIKSFNFENVVAAQRDGVWVTQAKNEGVLTDAYRKAKNVLLIFSVNKSLAIQGYVWFSFGTVLVFTLDTWL